MPHPPSLPLLVSFALSTASVFASSPADEENRIAYLPLSNKGSTAQEVLKHANGFKTTRPRPAVHYYNNDELPHRDQKGSAAIERVSVKLVERSGNAQSDAVISFGFPLPRGAIFRLDRIRVIDASRENQELPTQIHALTLWPDGSIKSALIQFKTPLAAQETRMLTVEYGHEVQPKAEAAESVKISKGKTNWIINTGKLEVSLSAGHFAPPGTVSLLAPTRLDAATATGLRLVDEQGNVFTSTHAPLDSLTLERAGKLEAVIRAEGALTSAKGDKLMRHITRLRFVAGSSKVETTVTIVNDALVHEFTDIRSLELGVNLPHSRQWNATFDNGIPRLANSGKITLTQWDENRLSLQSSEADAEEKAERANGAASINTDHSTLHFAYKDFWQRWPKGLVAEPGHFTVALLPQQVQPLEQQLPVHLQFPFVEGCYRTKWGTAFTERMVFDFGESNNDPSVTKAIAAVVQTPPLVIIPPAYLNKTHAFAPVPIEQSERLSRWTSYVDSAMDCFLAHRENTRQYGYLNWGDWHGERERNWGNNEYDIPHGFFIHYLLSGEGRYLDAAHEGVRHQADVDIVHSYPDPFYVGANPQHSIGHTGISYQTVIPKTWTYRYDEASSAGNGHTWADGMADCWLLTGDPVVMESLLALGEHIRWAFAPTFSKMGDHQRSAGWSSQAAAATFRATSDPEYLEGLKKILSLPLQTWDEKTGIWPYEINPGHADGKNGLFGASVYNLGILMMGISKYYDLTGDPRALSVLDGASAWLVKCWSEERAWPYAALADGSLFRQGLSPNLNPLVYPALAFAGKAANKEEYILTAAKALDVTFATPRQELLPKQFSMKMYATPWAISLLENTISTSAQTSTP